MAHQIPAEGRKAKAKFLLAFYATFLFIVPIGIVLAIVVLIFWGALSGGR
jgi:hypothetical protein